MRQNHFRAREWRCMHYHKGHCSRRRSCWALFCKQCDKCEITSSHSSEPAKLRVFFFFFLQMLATQDKWVTPVEHTPPPGIATQHYKDVDFNPGIKLCFHKEKQVWKGHKIMSRNQNNTRILFFSLNLALSATQSDNLIYWGMWHGKN